MSEVSTFIQSGILELYALGAASAAEAAEVERMMALHPDVRTELDAISASLEAYALAHAVEPPSTLKPLVLATIDYLERLKQGEEPTTPPELTAASTPEHFALWLERDDLKAPTSEEDIFVKIIGFTPAATTAIVWLKDVADEEVHHDEHERFLVLEGSCTITVGGQAHTLRAGDFFAIPLHQKHSVKVTSTEPCKVILQRLAA